MLFCCSRLIRMVCIFAPCLLIGCSDRQGRATQYEAQARDWCRQGCLDRAIKCISTAIKINPNNHSYYELRAGYLQINGEHDKAMADILAAMSLSPTNSHVYYTRGRIYAVEGLFNKAIEAYTQAIELDSRNYAAYGGRATVLHAKKEYARAIEDYTKMLNLLPGYYLGYVNRGTAWFAIGEYNKAKEDYAQAMRMKPLLWGDGAWLWNTRAWLHATCPVAELRDGEAAVNEATKACELSNWSNTQMLDTLATAYAETGNFTNAVKWGEKAVSLATPAEKKEILDRLMLFKDGKPYRRPYSPVVHCNSQRSVEISQ